MSDDRSFEELQRELEDVVTRLERGDVAVDDAIALFRRGEEVYSACVARLQGAELRIEELAPARAGHVTRAHGSCMNRPMAKPTPDAAA